VATKDMFTEDEWEALHKGATGAGLLVSVSDRDFTDSFGEASELAKRLRQEHEDAIGSAMATLAAKAPEERDAYRQFVLDLANAVAGAKGGVTPAETAAIEKITAALDA